MGRGNRGKGKGKGHQQRPASDASQNRTVHAPGSPPSAPPREINPSKPEANVDQQMIEWTAAVGRWTRRLTMATVIVGGIGIGVTISIGHMSDETQRSAQRPWIKFSDIQLLEPIHCEGQMVKAKIRVFLENGGNSPALHVDPRAFLDVSPESPSATRKFTKTATLFDKRNRLPVSRPFQILHRLLTTSIFRPNVSV